MSDIPIEWIIVPAIVATATLLIFIILQARHNSRIDAMSEEKPRKMWYQLGCKECGKPTPHAQITDGLCPECYAPVEAAADVRIEITPAMLNAGIDVLRDSPQRDARTAAETFNAMLKAMPVEQKRALIAATSPSLNASPDAMSRSA